MEPQPSPTADQPPKLRWFQYRLRSLFVLTTLVAVGCSWLTVTMQNQRRQKAAAEAIEKAGGWIESEPTWLGGLLRDASLVRVTRASFSESTTDPELAHHLQELRQLFDLSLTKTKVTDAGLVHLQGLNRLIWLNLRGTKVTDAGLAHLQGQSQLQDLDLSSTRVTNEGVDRLQEALPNCYINR
jgi:hypothetical protein